MRQCPFQSRHGDRLAGQLKIFLTAAILAALWPVSATAAPGDPGFIQFSVQDRDEKFIPIGEVEFCLNGNSGCVYADIDRGFPGHFYVNAKDLVPGGVYTVMIYTRNVRVIYEMRDWQFVAEDYDRGWDKVLNCEKFLIFPQFRGDPDGRMDFRLDTTLNPVWEQRAGEGLIIEEPDPLRFPDFIFAAQANAMLGGRFKSDTNAAGGVISVATGWQVTGTWRHGYPQRHAWDEGWVTCRELSLTYAQNRYDTAEVVTPGRVSDVIFHRLNLGYGMSRMNQSQVNHYGVAAIVSVGGIFDGGKKLQYLDRRYGLIGVGVQAHYRKMLLSGGGLEVGAVLEAGAIYYPSQADDNDFWFGVAPSASLGVVVF